MRRCFLLVFQNIPAFFVNQTCKHNGWHGQRKQNDAEQTCPDIRSRIHRYPIEQQPRDAQHQPRYAQQPNIGFRPAMPFVFASDDLKTQYADDSVYDPKGTHYQNHIHRDTLFQFRFSGFAHSNGWKAVTTSAKNRTRS